VGTWGSSPREHSDSAAAEERTSQMRRAAPSCIAAISMIDIASMVISKSERPRRADERAAAGDVASMPVTPAVFHILLALAEGESHGYGIMQDVDRLTSGVTKLGPGTLYRSIQRMLVDGLIEELAIALDSEADDDRRRYYRLTDKGTAVARAEAHRLADLVEAARERHLIGRPPSKGGRTR
jgi:DNA-binding PadR family transcriptional regulator